VQQGEAKAGEELLPLVYDELRRLAAHKIANEAPGHTLNPPLSSTKPGCGWFDLRSRPGKTARTSFAPRPSACVAILIDHARRKQQIRHGGGQERVTLDGLDITDDQDGLRLLEVNEALDRLGPSDSTKARSSNSASSPVWGIGKSPNAGIPNARWSGPGASPSVAAAEFHEG